MVTVSGLSGLTNAYTSVLSIAGSAATSGASRWLDATAAPGPNPYRPTPATMPVAARMIPARRLELVVVIICFLGCGTWLPGLSRVPVHEAFDAISAYGVVDVGLTTATNPGR